MPAKVDSLNPGLLPSPFAKGSPGYQQSGKTAPNGDFHDFPRVFELLILSRQ
jgi:hypothetical protein